MRHPAFASGQRRTARALRLFAGWLTIALLGGLAAGVPGVGGHAVAQDLFTVTNVAVDVTGESAAAAQKTALSDARRIAWSRLLNRLTPRGSANFARSIPDDQLAGLVRGLEVTAERSSSVRYVADISIVFARDAVRSLLIGLGVPFAETRSRPVLIVPLYDAGGDLLLWEETNPWRIAWQSLPRSDGLVPFIVPYGDIADIQDLSAADAASGGGARLGELTRRYGARDAAVIRAVPIGDSAGNVLSIQLSIARIGGAGPSISAIEEVLATGEDGRTLLQKAARRALGRLEQDWIQANIVRPGLETRVSVIVPIDSFAGWLATRDKLEKTAILGRVELTRFSRREAALDLLVQGGVDQLQTALAQSDLVLRELATATLLLQAGQPIPAVYLPSGPSSDGSGAETGATGSGTAVSPAPVSSSPIPPTSVLPAQGSSPDSGAETAPIVVQ